MIEYDALQRALCSLALLLATAGVARGQSDSGAGPGIASELPLEEETDQQSTLPTLEALKTVGALRSRYRTHERVSVGAEAPEPQLDAFRGDIRPVLEEACFRCHGPDRQKGGLRLDTLDPDLLHGGDVDWWLEVFSVLTNGEMPPERADKLAHEDRSKVIEWLASEIQVASSMRRAEQGHSSFRRMTRYEYNYALQDLLGLPYDFAKDLPPDPISEDGLQNSSDLLHMSSIQFRTYRESSRRALERATVRGERPTQLHWGVSMKSAAAREWARQDQQLEQVREQRKDDPEQLNLELERLTKRFNSPPRGTHYRNKTTGRTAQDTWVYGDARYLWEPTEDRLDVPGVSDHVAVIPPQQKLIVELGDQIPDEGTLRVRVRASRRSATSSRVPSLQLEFGWKASNDSYASVRISDRDLPIDAAPDHPQFYQWDIPLGEIYPRNSVRKTSKMGEIPSPSEFLRFVNSSVSQGDIQIDYVEISAPVHDSWPPASHSRIFAESANKSVERAYARELLERFIPRAWRREISALEVEQKLDLFTAIRPECDDFEEALVEVMASVLSSPHFLYLVRLDLPNSTGATGPGERLSDHGLATRLAIFLWCSIPDAELLELASDGSLGNPEVLTRQVERMLADPRSQRLSKHFVHQWLGMQLLDYLSVDQETYPQFDVALRESMQREPVEFFQEVLKENFSVLEFIHADFMMANERLAQHYGLNDVLGNHFRRVELEPSIGRGGLLTQAGLLAMNSDGKDSHPLKRGIWLLSRLLNDPPPPPPPAVPEIDLADPEIAKMTLRQRIENHRDHPACMSCHVKIDPWGIAFENFDAVGKWRTHVDGRAVDSTSFLFNKQKLEGMEGLKRFLLEYRQDQFTRALVHKLTAYALGRPLTFADRTNIEQITADLRERGDGLATMVTLIATSELFQSR